MRIYPEFYGTKQESTQDWKFRLPLFDFGQATTNGRFGCQSRIEMAPKVLARSVIQEPLPCRDLEPLLCYNGLEP